MAILQSGHYSTLIYYAFAVMWRSPISILCEWDWWVSAAAPDREIYSLWSILQEHPPLSTVIALWGLSKFKINYSGDGPTCLCVFEGERARKRVYFRQTHYMCHIFTFPSVFVSIRPINPWLCDVLHLLVGQTYKSTRALSPHAVRVHWHNLHGKKTLNASQQEVLI